MTKLDDLALETMRKVLGRGEQAEYLPREYNPIIKALRAVRSETLKEVLTFVGAEIGHLPPGKWGRGADHAYSKVCRWLNDQIEDEDGGSP